MEGTADFLQAEQHSIGRVRLRLADVLGDLRPLPTPEAFTERLRAVMDELESIYDELELMYHVSQAEQKGLSAKLEDIDRRLAQGWKPEASPVEDIVERLRPVAER
ncbi:hypothetical protein BH20ACT1_BH20ACT1_04000 [soil metagenome]